MQERTTAASMEGEDGTRERLLRLGPAALSDAELVEQVLGSAAHPGDVQSLARELVSVGGGLRALGQTDPQELCLRSGLGPRRAAQLICALELGRRAQRAQETRPRLRSPEDIHRYLWPSLVPLRREVFHVLCFNARNVLLHDARVAEGSGDSCPVDPREVFAPALLCRASALVLAHNHPSGDPEPSDEDLQLTSALAEGARLLGLKLLDHLVLGDGLYVSFAVRGLLAPRSRRHLTGSAPPRTALQSRRASGAGVLHRPAGPLGLTPAGES